MAERNSMAQLVEEWIELHADFLFRLAYRFCSNAADAEDLVQEAFLKAKENEQSLSSGPAEIRAWLVRVMRNTWLLKLRKDKRKRDWDPTWVDELAQSVGPGQVDIPVLADIQHHLDKMPWAFREPLVLHYLAEMGYRDIAKQLDIPMGTVMSRIARGRSWLRNRLGIKGSD